jgi:hypothetical protein
MTIRASRTSILVLLAIAGCGRDDLPPPQSRAATRPELSQATPTDLAREIEQAERRGTWREVRQRWEGQTLRWTVIRHEALCRSASACNVAAFPVQRPAQQGWLPELTFAPGEFAKLTAVCGADECELQIEATLDRLELSGELPTSVHLDQVRVLGVGKA